MASRTVLVSGASTGIGRASAVRLAGAGWDVFAGVRKPEDGESVKAESPDRIAPVILDVTDRATIEATAELVAGSVDGGLNALVNNAGRAPRVRADLLEASEDSFEELIRINLQGPYFLTQAVATEMVSRKASDPSFAAAVVFVTSVSAEMASIARGEYCVSKAGLAMAVRLFALRLASAGIPVYEVRPGIIATDMTAVVRDMYDARIADGLVPEKRWGQPEDVGRIVAALLRGDAPYATGSIIHVDGGLALPRL